MRDPRWPLSSIPERPWRSRPAPCILPAVRSIFAAGAALAGLVLALESVSPAEPPAPKAAAALYDRYCLACHGATGDGGGPAAPWLWPRPRDFRRGVYKWRSTPSGMAPLDADLVRAIRYGAAGTSMHAFGDSLSEPQLTALVAHLKTLAPERFDRRAPPIEVPDIRQPPSELIARGSVLYSELGCPSCHGAGGRGDGPAAAQLRDDSDRPAPPYDLLTHPLRRPRDPDSDPALAVYTSLVTGLDGTPMPAYGGAASAADLWAVAVYVVSLSGRAPAPPAELRVPSVARDAAVRGGYHPGGGHPGDELAFGAEIAPQGPPPASLAPAQASLYAAQCARCHNKQFREWRKSVHASAASPGVLAQLLALERRGKGAELASCQRCHAPLAEQSPAAGAAFHPALRVEGITCASCHLRGWKRLGPLEVAASLLPVENYPKRPLPIYERSDFCLPCHQLSPKNFDGKPLLNTYREWLEGPYMRRGIQCQHCHMPNREHTWKGVHDPSTFRQGIAVAAAARRRRGERLVARARIENVGAGHYLPTTPTPAVYLTVELVDRAGRAIPGTRKDKRIGRHLVFDGALVELEDTRIPPGEAAELEVSWRGRGVVRASALRVSVRVWPDEYYERFYRRRLANPALPARERDLYADALARAEASHYVAYRRDWPIATGAPRRGR